MILVHTEQCFLIKFQTAQATAEPNFMIWWAIFCKKLYFPIKNRRDFRMVSGVIIIDHEQLKGLLKALES